MGGTAVVLCLVLQLMQEIKASAGNCIPRKTVKFQTVNAEMFVKEGLSNVSTLLVDEETDRLFVGGRDVISALDLNNISREIAKEHWFATQERQLECIRRGKDKIRCQNYILILHKMNDSHVYVCGTNAYHPLCDHMVIQRTKMRLQGRAEESRGKCPFEPTLKYASVFVDGAFYSATSNNFLGTEPIILRSMQNPVRTEFKTSWLNEPSFVGMEIVPESEFSPDGDDDKIYVFFTETAVEFEFYDKILVSRIARICKGDLGGKRLLQRRWTSFLKARLSCSIPELNFHFSIIQDIFFLRRGKWQDSIFYGIFSQQWGRLDISAVCAYSMASIQEAFSKGSYRGPVTVEHSHVRWMAFRGEVPVPRPGACIDNFARNLGYNTSSDLPDKVLQFARDHPLMDASVNPIGDRPALLKRSSNYTRIVVDRVTGLDKQTYDVMFLGTDDGYLHKAFNCDGEMFIVEELQLFLSPEPVQFLQLSAKKGMLYVGSLSAVVQLPVSGCQRYKQCLDCILARDPYCAWSQPAHACVLLSDQSADTRNLIQNVKYGDASSCLSVENDVRKYLVTLGNNVHLKCVPLSNLARVVWKFNGSRIRDKDSKYLLYDGGIAIFNATVAETGFYDCLSVERSKAKEFFITVARYALYARQSTEKANVDAATDSSNEAEAVGFQSSVSTYLLKDATKQKFVGSQKENLVLKLLGAGFALLFFFLFIWNFYKGHISLPWRIRDTGSRDTDADLENPELTTERSGAVRESSAVQKDTSFLNE
ncbi:semaphorin-4E-like [Phasianus colchicus]|uniref:semaphorin-4E-like n=1 Tax=Phasianus colchicus TaxID=9054 RepID=UPI00129DF42A|nr:semaphorin-4E-like [Phasianus colchicus]XP_031459954.1 semaphorin-4E-like [Phasianus colchicus]